jgi:hypothetical protein
MVSGVRIDMNQIVICGDVAKRAFGFHPGRGR